MSESLTRDDVRELIEDLRRRVPREACWTCDCLQGFLVQLGLDAGEDVGDLVAPLRVSSEKMHGCLGCDPCPPGAAYADHLRKQTK